MDDDETVLDRLTVRLSPADQEVIKGLQGYLMSQQMALREGTRTDAVRFALHLAGLVLTTLADAKKPPSGLVVALRETHAVLNELEGLPS